MNESILLTTQDQKDFVKTIIPDFIMSTTIKLLYRGSRDGWRGQEDFHRLCDNKGPTIALVKSSVGRVCGAYLSVPYANSGDWKKDNKAVKVITKIKITPK